LELLRGSNVGVVDSSGTAVGSMIDPVVHLDVVVVVAAAAYTENSGP